MIAHIVLFTPKAELTEAERRSFAKSVAATLRQITSIQRATVGRHIDVDPGYKRTFGDKTYQFAAVLEFSDRAALVDYLRNPLHEDLGRLFWETCAASVICEVESADIGDPVAVELLWRVT